MSERKAPGVHTDPVSETWKSLPWRKLERHVFRIQKRIYRASQRGNQRAVQKLQKLLLKSRAARLLAVQEAREQTGEQAASGTDDGPADVAQIHPRRWRDPLPSPQKQQPSGSLPGRERAQQTLVSMALEPVWTLPCGQGSQQALRALREAMCTGGQYVLSADLQECLAAINQQALLRKLALLPALARLIRAWLADGARGVRSSAESRPVAWLVNMALHGLHMQLMQACCGQGQVVHAAGELVVLHPTLVGVQQARALMQSWLRELNLTWQAGNLRITHTLNSSHGQVGFAFLGWWVRHYPCGKNRAGRSTAGQAWGCLVCIRPGRALRRQHLAHIKGVLDQHKAASQETVIRALNPLIEDWALSCRAVGAVADLADCDHHLCWLLWRWARRRHPHKGQAWIRARYWQRTAARGWVFGLRAGPTLRLHARATPFALPVATTASRTTGVTHG